MSATQIELKVSNLNQILNFVGMRVVFRLTSFNIDAPLKVFFFISHVVNYFTLRLHCMYIGLFTCN